MAEIKKDTRKTTFLKGIKMLGFSTLLITVIYFYGVDIYKKFQNDATTFTLKTEKMREPDDFLTPPILICMENLLKPTVMKKYGLENIMDFFVAEEILKESSVWDVFIEATYILDRDFSLFLWNHESHIKNKTTWKNLSTGNDNSFMVQEKEDVYNVIVQEYYTYLAGTCYQITSNYSIPPPDGYGLTLLFEESLNLDLPTVCIMYNFVTTK